jgi:hypothetical protein
MPTGEIPEHFPGDADSCGEQVPATSGAAEVAAGQGAVASATPSAAGVCASKKTTRTLHLMSVWKKATAILES